MNTEDYESVIKATLSTLETGDDSILSKSKVTLKEYLDNNTSLTDNEKAGTFAKFMTEITTSVMTQAINAAVQLSLETPLNDQKVKNFAGELLLAGNKSVSDISVNTQTIASSKNRDIIAKNEVATKIATAKAQVEVLIPAQVDEIRENIKLKAKSIELEAKKTELMEKDITLKGKQVSLMGVQISLEKVRIPLMKAQALVEQKKVSLMAVQVSTELKKVGLMGKQLLVEAEKIPLMIAQTANEVAKTELTRQQVGVEKSKIKLQKAEIDLRYADIFYRQQQARTVASSLIVNERIENNKNETSLKIATLQAASI